ncbi:hypothetical protein [Caloramator sp.]|uniref:hypothetical protein n=1 Tax=Caloramator sp. TaxID=1871330 RepID=UPI0025C44F2D|nr:hypothetical protein [Caloramator sp.]
MNYKYKRLISYFLIGIGTVMILIFVPFWIWMTAIGFIFIYFGIKYYNNNF